MYIAKHMRSSAKTHYICVLILTETLQLHIPIHTQKCTYTHIRTHTYAHVYMQACTQVYAYPHAYTHVNKHTCMYRYKLVYSLINIHTYLHSSLSRLKTDDTYRDKHAHTFIYTMHSYPRTHLKTRK